MVQPGVSPAMLNRKLCKMRSPSSVWATSGWNCKAYMRRSTLARAAMSTFFVRAATTKPAGGATTLSPWDIQTVREPPSGRPAKSGTSARTVSSARPYSRSVEAAIAPPGWWWASSCMP